MSKLDKDQVVAKFTAAYEAANGKSPEIEAKGGWYSVDGGKNMRLAALDELADELSGGNHAEADDVVEAEDTVSAETATEETPKAVPVKKKSTSAANRFSVKSFWIEQLDQDKPGSTAPR